MHRKNRIFNEYRGEFRTFFLGIDYMSIREKFHCLSIR